MNTLQWDTMLPTLSVYAQNARLRKRVAALRKLLDETIDENCRLREGVDARLTALEDMVAGQQ